LIEHENDAAIRLIESSSLITFKMKLKQSTRPAVSVILLSYNRPACLREALASLLNQSYENLSITVVDNPSPTSAEISIIVAQYKNVKLIRNSVNQGYAGGMNRGIEQAVGQYVHLTEDDIILEKDCIQRLVEYMSEHPCVNLVSPIIYNKASKTIRCAGGEFALGGVYRKRVYGAGELDIGQFSQPFDVSFIDGATMFARGDFWKSFKGFREEYFMYVEAIELCARVIKAGQRMAIVPRAKVSHVEPPPQQSISPEIEFHKIKNFFSLYLLHAPLRVLPEFICRYALWNTLRAMLMRRGVNGTRLRALLWVLKKTPALLMERRRASFSKLDQQEDIEGAKRVLSSV
jgi:GT2 family glycosyltransferase